MKVPSVNYQQAINVLHRDGWVVVRQKGSHIRLQKHVNNETLKIIVPAHRPIKRSTLSHILKQAQISIDKFIELL
ncbi:type II toxin-antitoxin system HicA family toxin [Candidatus Desantisbacteria bacterium]|nr:type II toxin-antitoxin system HicA family toxin [Candidatus Desantisbacteria bacterium]MBI4846318.1 type II toxin-antitoxin system HicA family toxin [Candidatus Omnitrophota bacterium]